MCKELVIIGASGHGRVIGDIAKLNGYEQIIFLDDNESLKECAGYPVCGTSNETVAFGEKDFIVGIGDNKTRKIIQERLYGEKLRLTTLVHPKAVIAEGVKIGNGSVIMAGTVINVGCEIGGGCIINTGATVDHDSRIEDFVHISVGSHLAGNVVVGANSFIGAGTTIINNITIPAKCTIGAGTVVIKSINEEGTYVGVPARKM